MKCRNHSVRASICVFSSIIALLVLFGGAWLGASYPEDNWQKYFLIFVMLFVVGIIAWILGYYTAKTISEQECNACKIWYDSDEENKCEEYHEFTPCVEESKRPPFNYDEWENAKNSCTDNVDEQLPEQEAETVPEEN